MRAPTGSVVGLCAASATMSALGMAFLGYWGVHEASPWHWHDVAAVTLAFLGFAVLASTPWIVTTPVENESEERIVAARRAFAIGTALIWLAALMTVIG